MIATGRARLIAARLERWGLGTIARLLAPLFDTGGRSGGAHLRSLALTSMRRTALGRHILLAAAVSLAGVALGAALLAQLLGLWPL
jgi:hypothetical protein